MKYKQVLSLCLATLMLFMSVGCQPQGGTEAASESSASETTLAAPSSSSEETSAEETTASARPTPIPVSAEDIPYFNGGMKRTDYDCGDGVYMKVVSSVFEREYTAYVEGLASLGYEQVSDRSIGENHFKAFRREGTALIASYFGADDTARLTILPYDPFDAYSDIYAPTEAEGGEIEPLITMVDSGNNGKDVGMSYVIRTPKGSFIIIDGGWTGVGEGKKLRNLLREQNTNGSTPVIAAWILTHPHSDHIGAIADVAAAYYDEVVLERVIFNYMSDDMLLRSDSSALIGDQTSPVNVLRNTLESKKKWGYTQVIKPHTGDLLNIDGVLIDILYTHEDVAPDTSALEYNNAASMAFKVSVGAKSAIFFADSTASNMLAMAKRYGEHLKSDILQPTHHGRTHGRIEVYSLVLPELVLWDCALSSYNEYKDRDYNQYLINSVKRHYISQNGTVTFSFVTLDEQK